MADERYWFLNSLVVVRASHTEGPDGLSVLDHRVSLGDAPPLHIHRTEDEVFVVLEGELRLVVGGQERRAKAGESFCAPKNVPHGYRVVSPNGARFITVTAHADFECFVKAVARPARGDGMPPASAPTPEQIAALAETAKKFGIEFVGPPLA